MSQRTWFIRGVSSGFGRQLTDQRLERGDRVVGTVHDTGGARTEFRYGSAQVANLTHIYDQTPAHSFVRMLDPKNGLAPGDPARMAARSIESVDVNPVPLRIVLGSQVLASTISTLRKRIVDLEAQTELAASTDLPPGE